MNIALLTLLADAKPHTYSQICQTLALDSATLMTELEQLQQSGIQLIKEEQYCYWLPTAELLDRDFLQQALPHNHLIIKPVIDSTNQYVLDHLRELANNSVCLAEYQTAGRGRRGRKWLSPFAGQVILSFYRTFAKEIPLSGLSLAIGIAVARALTLLNFQQVQLKWPNDIWLAGKKLGGILIEMKQHPDLSHYQVVIGIGLNVALPTEMTLDQPIAMLSQQQKIDRNLVIKELILQLNSVLDLFSEQGLTPLLAEWQQYDLFYQQPVKLLLEKQQLSGIEQGITAQGELLLQTEQGEIKAFAIGEISLRGKE